MLWATGALEQPIAFPNNDRPGIMLANALQTYAIRHGVELGQGLHCLSTMNKGSLRPRLRSGRCQFGGCGRRT